MSGRIKPTCLPAIMKGLHDDLEEPEMKANYIGIINMISTSTGATSLNLSIQPQG